MDIQSKPTWILIIVFILIDFNWRTVAWQLNSNHTKLFSLIFFECKQLEITFFYNSEFGKISFFFVCLSKSTFQIEIVELQNYVSTNKKMLELIKNNDGRCGNCSMAEIFNKIRIQRISFENIYLTKFVERKKENWRKIQLN